MDGGKSVYGAVTLAQGFAHEFFSRLLLGGLIAGRVGTRFAPSCAAWLRAIRTNWPNTQMCADSHYCCLEVLDWCRANGLDYILGIAQRRPLA
jgi:hypothetical protein